jgi:hypothetical protein
MPAAEGENVGSAGISRSAEALDVPALLAQLEDEVRLLGARHGAAPGATAERLSARATADRVWPVSADRHLGGRGGAVGAVLKPVKLVLRALARPSVEPALAEQRAFNDAILHLVDELQRRLDAARVELGRDLAGPAP